MSHGRLNLQPVVDLPDELDFIRFESNLVQIGFFSAQDQRHAATKPLVTEHHYEHEVLRNGKPTTVGRTLRCAIGLPSIADQDKYMAFMQIAMEQKRRYGVLENPIHFTGYEMLKILGLADSGDNYEAIDTWGNRMKETAIISNKSIYLANEEVYGNDNYSVFRRFSRRGIRPTAGGSGQVCFTVELEDWVLENINKGYLILENAQAYKKLNRRLAKALYGLLHWYFFASKGKPVSRDYADLCQLLNVSCYRHLSKIRETIGKSLDELVSIRYLSSWDIVPMTSKAGYKINMVAGTALLRTILAKEPKTIQAGGPPEMVPHTLTAGDSGEQAAVQASLVSFGIDKEKAEFLVRTFELSSIRDHLEYVSHEVRKADLGRFKNPAGFLIDHIEKRREIPLYFETTSMREKREAQERQLRRAKEDKAGDFLDQQEYARWREDQAKQLIEETMSRVQVSEKLREIRQNLDHDVRSTFLRMRPDAQQKSLMGQLVKLVMHEMELPTFEDWKIRYAQPALFQ